jgi:S-adenosylmethionine:tRNA ribosyltransferase-isomerase
MIAASAPTPAAPKLLFVATDGTVVHAVRKDLPELLRPGDLVVANDAATLPASLRGIHARTGAPVEIRLAAWRALGDPTRFVAVAFGVGDHRTRTEDRPPPPTFAEKDALVFGPLKATIEQVLGHPRLVALRFEGTTEEVWAGIAAHGRPIQYAHVPDPLKLWDAWTKIASRPLAFEPPSAGFALDWKMLARFHERGVGFATLTLAAGISSTGDIALDRRLPFDEHFAIPEKAADAVARTRASSGRVVAIGTTTVRALEAAALKGGIVRAGEGIATAKIGPHTLLRVADAILSGVHAPGESHYELLRAFTSDAALRDMTTEADAHGYRNHEFGDSVLIERAPRLARSRTRIEHPFAGKLYSTTPMIGP